MADKRSLEYIEEIAQKLWVPNAQSSHTLGYNLGLAQLCWELGDKKKSLAETHWDMLVKSDKKQQEEKKYVR